MRADRDPSLEPPRRGIRIDARRTARDVLVPLVVAQAVDEPIAHLSGVRELATVITIAPDRPAPTAGGGVVETIRAHGEALHATCEGRVVFGFDDEMQVIALHRELDDAKVLAPR